MKPGVQLVQSFARWGCGTVRYAITEDMLVLSGIVRMFFGNFTIGWDELSVKTTQQVISRNLGTCDF